MILLFFFITHGNFAEIFLCSILRDFKLWRFMVPISSGSGSRRSMWRCPDMICMTLNFNTCNRWWWVFTKELLDSCGLFIVYVGRCVSWLISIVNLCYLTFCTWGRPIVRFLLKASFNISLVSVTVLASLKENLKHACCTVKSLIFSWKCHRTLQSHFVRH
jgi:hypothetical protein